MAPSGTPAERAAALISQICDLAAPRNSLAAVRRRLIGDNVVLAVANRDTPALYAWLMEVVSYQGVADRVARAYLDRHGRVQWRHLDIGVAAPELCPKLTNYWTFQGCGFRKHACSCARPERLADCVIGALSTRNGNLAQAAAALFLFLRDVCGGDFVGWVDAQLATSLDVGAEPMIEKLRGIYGVSYKVLSLALAELLLGGRPDDPLWRAAGARLIVVDTLVHNWLHRAGLLDAFGARHAYGRKCYAPNGCADIIRQAADRIDARRYGRDNPTVFPRLVQSAIWRFCAAEAFNICNGNRIDDRAACDGAHCPIAGQCGRVWLREADRAKRGTEIRRRDAR